MSIGNPKTNNNSAEFRGKLKKNLRRRFLQFFADCEWQIPRLGSNFRRQRKNCGPMSIYNLQPHCHLAS